MQQRLRTAERLAEQLRAAAEPSVDQPVRYTSAPATAPPPPPQRTFAAPVRSLESLAIQPLPDAGLEFSITADDIYAYNLFCIRHVPAVRRVRRQVSSIFLLVALAPLVLCLLPGTVVFRIVLLCIGLTALVLPITYIFFPGVLVRKQIEQSIQRGVYKHTLGRQVLSIDPEGYVIAIEGLDTRRSWVLVSDVVADESYLYLFVNPQCANMIPRHACATDQQWSDLSARIKSYYDAAISGRESSE